MCNCRIGLTSRAVLIEDITCSLPTGWNPYRCCRPQLAAALPICVEVAKKENKMKTGGTCGEWRPEPGEMILLGPDENELEFIAMTKNGEHYICHGYNGDTARLSSVAKPAPKDWTDLVSEDNQAICWVWGMDEENKMVSLIKEIRQQVVHKFASKNGTNWTNAKFIMWAKGAK